jgi:GxxExxY protein
MDEEIISKQVIGSAIEVHRALGPGMLESVYQKCLGKELVLRGLEYREEVPLPVHYKGMDFEAPLRLDFLVGGKVIVELKAVETVLPVHEAQLLSYLRLAGLKLGLLINFNVPVMKSGIRRIVNNL